MGKHLNLMSMLSVVNRAPLFLIYLLQKHITLKGSHFCITIYLTALNAHWKGRSYVSEFFNTIPKLICIPN